MVCRCKSALNHRRPLLSAGGSTLWLDDAGELVDFDEGFVEDFEVDLVVVRRVPLFFSGVAVLTADSLVSLVSTLLFELRLVLLLVARGFFAVLLALLALVVVDFVAGFFAVDLEAVDLAAAAFVFPDFAEVDLAVDLALLVLDVRFFGFSSVVDSVESVVSVSFFLATGFGFISFLSVGIE